MLGVASRAPAQPREFDQPRPFTAVYAVQWHGITAGYSTLELRRTGPFTFIYSSRIRASGIFRLAFPDVAEQTSAFQVRNGHVMPLHYEERNGAGNKAQDVTLYFDWNARRVSGTQGERRVEQPLEPGTQDPLSVQIELMDDLRAGKAPTSFVLFDKREATRYNYTAEGSVTIETELGALPTLIYRSDRPGSTQVMRLWLAPSLGYIPVQGERMRRGKVDLSLLIRELTGPT